MRFVLLCAAAFVAAPVLANELVTFNGADSVRLSDNPCTTQQVLDRVQPEFHAALRDASAVVGGKLFRACWAVNGRAAHLIYEDGDQGLIPLQDFKVPLSV